jgi:DNA-binding transcriptional regulator LsrR (DeoR family)
MTDQRLAAAAALHAQGLTLNEIAASLGVGRSSVVRSLAKGSSTAG